MRINVKNSKSNLFFIELIICILFFMIAAAICTQVFVKAYTINQDTVAINNTLLWIQNFSALFEESPDDFTLTQNIYKNDSSEILNDTENNSYILIYCDKDWHTVTSYSLADYIILCIYYKDSSFAYEDIYISSLNNLTNTTYQSKNGITLNELMMYSTSIYEITLKKHLPINISKGETLYE